MNEEPNGNNVLPEQNNGVGGMEGGPIDSNNSVEQLTNSNPPLNEQLPSVEEPPVQETPVQEPPVQEQMTQPMEPSTDPITPSTEMNSTVMNDPSNNKHNGQTKLLLVFVILAVVIIAGVLVYLKFFSKEASPKEYYASLFDTLASNIESITNKEKSNVISGNLSFDSYTDSNDETLKLISNIDLSIDFDVDINDKSFTFNVAGRYKDGNLLNAGLYKTNNRLYITEDYLLDGDYYYIDLSNFTLDTSNFESNNINGIAEKIINILKNNLKDEYFTVEKNDSETNSYSLKLTNAYYKEYFTNVINEVKADDELLTDLADFNGQTKEDSISTLDENLIELESFTEELEINLISKDTKSNPDRIQIFVKENGVNKETVDITIDGDTYKYTVTGEETDSVDGEVRISSDDRNTDVDLLVRSNGIEANIRINSSSKDNLIIPDISNAELFDSNSLFEDGELNNKISQNETISSFISDILRMGN